VDESDEPCFGYEMASRATAYRCWHAHGDVGLLDTRTPPGWKPLPGEEVPASSAVCQGKLQILGRIREKDP
jgi:hypothetical protein